MRTLRSLVVSTTCILVVAAMPASASSERADPACDVVKRFNLACTSTSIGAVVADTHEDAKRLKAHAERGEARFERFLGVRPGEYLFIAGNGGRYSAAARAVGRKSSLNWPSAAQRMDLAALRESAKATLANVPMSEAERAAAIEAFIKANSSTKADQDIVDSIAVPHELAHVWFTRAFWPSAPLAHDDYYAGPGPDWLDEGVTQIMETSGTASYEETKYQEAISGPYAIRRGELATLLTEQHPGQRMKKIFAGRSFIPAAETKALGIDPPRFYVRSAALTAFILAQSPDQHVLAEIARAYADGTGFEAWLARNGQQNRLGSTIGEMEQLLLAWLAQEGMRIGD